MTQVATGDELPLGVVGEPVTATAEQLVDLVVADPVVLVVVEHRQEHVQVLQDVLDPGYRRQAYIKVRAQSPLDEAAVERSSGGDHLVAERLEQRPEHLLAAPAG